MLQGLEMAGTASGTSETNWSKLLSAPSHCRGLRAHSLARGVGGVGGGNSVTPCPRGICALKASYTQ